jgi:hypothetical protein
MLQFLASGTSNKIKQFEHDQTRCLIGIPILDSDNPEISPIYWVIQIPNIYIYVCVYKYNWVVQPAGFSYALRLEDPCDHFSSHWKTAFMELFAIIIRATVC